MYRLGWSRRSRRSSNASGRSPTVRATRASSCTPSSSTSTLFVEERDGAWQLSGLIDFADGRVGPAEYDFPAVVEFVLRGERGLLPAFLLGYGGYGDCDRRDPVRSAERLLAWGLCHRYGRLRRMLSAVSGEARDLGQLAERLYAVR